MSLRTEPMTGGRSPTAELIQLALPIIAMTVSRMMMGFIDVIMVSRLGTEALAAISPAAMMIFIVGVLGLGIANAIQTFVSQADGRGERHICGAYGWQSLYIAAAFLVLTIPAVLTMPVWLTWIANVGNHAPAVRAMEMDYLHIALWSIAPSIVCIGLNGFFMGVQKPWVALAAVVASLGVNALGNWLLIFGHWGFPELGIAGAAYATVVAWLVRAAVLAGAMLLPAFHDEYRTRDSFAYSAEKMAGMLKVGAPIAIGWLFDLGSWAAFMIVIMPRFGTEAMAAANVGMQLMHLSFMPAIGIGIALTSQVGFAIGKGESERAYMRARVALRLTGLYMGIIGLLFWLVPDVFLTLFSPGPEVMALGRQILIWAAIFQVFDAMTITHMSALRGAGDTRWPAWVVAIGCWVVFIGGGLAVALLKPAWGVNGPWAMCTLYIIGLGVLLTARWYGGKWRNIQIFDDAKAVAEPGEATPAAAAAADLLADGTEVAPDLLAGPDEAVAASDTGAVAPDAAAGTSETGVAVGVVTDPGEPPTVELLAPPGKAPTAKLLVPGKAITAGDSAVEPGEAGAGLRAGRPYPPPS